MKRRPNWRLFKHQRIYLKDGALYLRRWVLDLFAFSIRLHCFYASDDDRALHDHPFDFITLILKGGYFDVTRDKNGFIDKEPMLPGKIRFRPHTHTHTVELVKKDQPTWTLIVTGPVQHRWGFYVMNSSSKMRFLNSQRYFRKFGHH